MQRGFHICRGDLHEGEVPPDNYGEPGLITVHSSPYPNLDHEHLTPRHGRKQKRLLQVRMGIQGFVVRVRVGVGVGSGFVVRVKLGLGSS